MELCNHHQNQFQNIFIIPKRNPIYINSHSSFILKSSIPRSPQIYFVSLDLPTLDISHKWNHTIICGLLWLASFTRHVHATIVLYHVISTSFYFRCWIVFYCMHTSSFLILSSSDGHSSCFHFGAITKNEKLTKRGHVSSPGYWARIGSSAEGQSRETIHQIQVCTASERTSQYRKKMSVFSQKGKEGTSVKGTTDFLLCSMKQAYEWSNLVLPLSQTFRALKENNNLLLI